MDKTILSKRDKETFAANSSIYVFDLVCKDDLDIKFWKREEDEKEGNCHSHDFSLTVNIENTKRQ